MVGIGQTFCGSGWHWSAVSIGAGEIGKTFCGNGQDWSTVSQEEGRIGEKHLWEWAGLVKISAELIRIIHKCHK